MTNVHVLYGDLNKLLEDVCEFLNEEVNNDRICGVARIKANKLIARSKHQLQEIAKLSISLNDNESYVDMQGNKVNIEEQEECVIYDQIDDEVKPQAERKQTEEICPFSDLPAKNATTEKCGYIALKTKIFFGLEKNKQIYASVYNNWFLIYTNERDLKPNQTINLKQFQHKVNDEQNKHCFSLYNDKKNYHFTALSNKDLLQWISAIKRSCNAANVDDEGDDDDDDDEIYQQIINPKSSIVNSSLPSLPPRSYDESSSGSDTDEIYNQIEYPVKSDVQEENGDDGDDEIYNLVCPPDEFKQKTEQIDNALARQSSFLSRHCKSKFGAMSK